MNGGTDLVRHSDRNPRELRGKLGQPSLLRLSTPD